MSPKIIVGLIGAVGLVTGIIAGRHFSAKGAGGEAVPQREESSQADCGEGRLSSPATSLNEDRGLPQLLRVVRNYYDSGDPLALREIERLETPELRRLIEDLMTSLSRDASEESQAIGRLIQVAIKEWYRRDGEKALQQAEALPEGETRRMILSQLINAAAYETPELGKKWADRFRGENGKDWYRYVVMAAVQGAISRSAEDFLKLTELFKGEEVHLGGYARFAEDFDFSKVVEKVTLGYGVDNLMAHWAAKDPEAAWEMARKAVGEHGEKAANQVGGIFQGISTVKGDGEAEAWLANHIEEVPEAALRRVFESLRSVDFLSPERSATVMAALTGKDERMLFASVLLDPHNDQGNGLAGLRALDSDATRVEALMVTAKKYSPGMGNGGSDHFKKVHGYFDRTMEELNLPPDTRETVKAALAPPEEDDER